MFVDMYVVYCFLFDWIEINDDGIKGIYFWDVYDDFDEVINCSVFLLNIFGLVWKL